MSGRGTRLARLGPPAFGDAAVEVGPGPGWMTLHLRYLAGR